MKYGYLAIGLWGFATLSFGMQAPVVDVNTESVEQRIATLERLVNSRTNVQHNVQSQLDLMQDEVNELRGVLETHNYKLDQILQRQRELYLEIDNRIEAAFSDNDDANSVAANVGADNNSNYVLAAGENEAYDKAINLILRDKKYDEAIPQFESFLSRFPDSQYAPNAHYWLGQLLFNKQELAKAESHFISVMSGFPDSNKRPDAILKLGEIAQRNSNLSKARELFEQVISEYPDSSVRGIADTRLRSLTAN
jgi:tol-pal system protein YbgF